MVTSALTYPECGWETADNKDGDLYNRSLVTDGSGPGGRNFVLFDFIQSAVGEEFGAWGWAQGSSSQNVWEGGVPVPQGQARYIRYRAKVFSPHNFNVVAPAGSGTKIVDLGQGAEQGGFQPTRVVSQLYGSVNGRFDLTLYQGGGGGTTITTQGIALDTWKNIQIKCQSSTTETATDGFVAYYIDADNDSEATPTEIYAPGDYQAIKTGGWPGGAATGKTLFFGGTIGRIGLSDSFKIGLTDFEYDDAFDPNWNSP